MAQAYSDPKRASDPHALPDVEVFYVSLDDIRNHREEARVLHGDSDEEAGWYYWFCFPGCLPDSDPAGPFSTQDEAVKAAQEESSDDDA